MIALIPGVIVLAVVLVFSFLLRKAGLNSDSFAFLLLIAGLLLFSCFLLGYGDKFYV